MHRIGWKWVALTLFSVVGAAGFLEPAHAGGAVPSKLDCASLACADVLPGAESFESVPGAAYQIGRGGDGELVGWVALSTEFVEIKAYSGKPLVTLVGLDPSGLITGASVVHHSEPILLVGIPESELHTFVASYAGKRATERIVIGHSSREGDIEIDAISGATVTVLAQNHTILEVARRLGVEVGVISLSEVRPGSFVTDVEPWSFEKLVDEGALGRLTVSEAEMGAGDSNEPFVDLFFTIADASHVGRSLIGDHEYAYYMSQLAPDEHLVVVLGRGSSSFKGSAFVRGGVFDRVRLDQGLREISFRDTDYRNLSGAAVADAPEFSEGAIFFVRKGLLDPGAEFDLVFLGSRYDQRGAFSREFHEFRAGLQLPTSVYVSEGSDLDAPWRQAWRNRALESGLLMAWLLFVGAIFVWRKHSTADPDRLKQLHTAVMAVSFLGIGVWMNAQPSVTQIFTVADSVRTGWRWDLFLSEPMIFTLWIFIAVTSLIWGRGVFCGWVCPYGAMTELLSKLTSWLGFEPRELPERWHLRLRNVRYVVLVLLVATFLWDSVLGERFAEIEPFKSTFLVPAWGRGAGLFAWWLALIAVSLVMYRPFCRYLCPLGGGLSLISSFRPLGPRRRRFCTSCKICTRGCESRAFRSDGSIDPRECLSCLDCEATYRNENVCPPLLAIQRLEVRQELGPRHRRKLEALGQQVRDV